MERRTVVTGPASPVEVWERYAQPARWPDWAPQIRGVEASAVRIAPGVTGRVRGPLRVRVSFVVAEVDAKARMWSWDVRFGPLRMHLRHGVDVESGGTATWLVVRGPALAVAAYLPVARYALRRLVRRPRPPVRRRWPSGWSPG